MSHIFIRETFLNFPIWNNKLFLPSPKPPYSIFFPKQLSPSKPLFRDSLVTGKDGKVSACNAEDLGSIPGSGRSPGEGKWQPIPVFLPGKFYGRRSLVGYCPWGHKESDTTEWLHFTSNLYLFIYFPFFFLQEYKLHEGRDLIWSLLYCLGVARHYTCPIRYLYLQILVEWMNVS